MKFTEFSIPDSLTGSAFIAVLTDQVICGIYKGRGLFETMNGPIQDMDEKLLELRIFNDQEEFRAFRPYRDMDFKCRYINDRDETKPYFDEVHYLDQDSNKTKPAAEGYTSFVTTGGGTYILPGDAGIRKVMVRTYLEESEETNGIQIPGDWRIIGFAKDSIPGEEAK